MTHFEPGTDSVWNSVSSFCSQDDKTQNGRIGPETVFTLWLVSMTLNTRYSFHFCGMFWPLAPTAACGTCCQRVNCVGFLNVHHHVALKAWRFLLGFCMAVLKSLISVHLADLGSSVFGLACPCCYEAVIQMVSTSIHSVSLYILLVLVYPVGWMECF